MTKTPDEIVAERIVASLTEQKLIPEHSLKGLAEKLIAGSLKAEDWRLFVDLNQRPEGEAGDGEENGEAN
ncbi:MAG: hypothetical protein QOD00_2872 [Blastocatellia bacterium]|nr:hypothetical protein [Blastocatellia bacterium]